MGKYEDITGRKYGRLTVVGREPSDKGVRWRALCDCGNVVITNTHSLKSGEKRSCGCLLDEWRNKTHIDIIGKRYGRLKVVSNAETVDKRLMFSCRCDCGRNVTVRKDALTSGHTTSCGCLWNEVSKDGARTRTHGKSEERLYWIWHGLKDRCYNPNSRSYHRYGGAGVKVCDEWRDDFQSFYDWAMSTGYDKEAPTRQCTLDRINPCGNYEPSNCRWIDNRKQQNNKRHHRYVEYEGKRLTMTEFSTLTGVNYAIAYHHIVKLGESAETIISNYVK